jgi:hypothetical protein
MRPTTPPIEGQLAANGAAASAPRAATFAPSDAHSTASRPRAELPVSTEAWAAAPAPQEPREDGARADRAHRAAQALREGFYGAAGAMHGAEATPRDLDAAALPGGAATPLGERPPAGPSASAVRAAGAPGGHARIPSARSDGVTSSLSRVNSALLLRTMRAGHACAPACMRAHTLHAWHACAPTLCACAACCDAACPRHGSLALPCTVTSLAAARTAPCMMHMHVAAGQASDRAAAGRQASPAAPLDVLVSATSMHADNLPEPYQPPASNATSEDVHVGLGALPRPMLRAGQHMHAGHALSAATCAEKQYSSYEDALLDVKHGGEDVDIPWDAYDEEDKMAAAGCRSAMTYRRR